MKCLAHKWVVDDEYFETEWLAVNSERLNLPVVLNLSGLYEHILRELIPQQLRELQTASGRRSAVLYFPRLIRRAERGDIT